MSRAYAGRCSRSRVSAPSSRAAIRCWFTMVSWISVMPANDGNIGATGTRRQPRVRRRIRSPRGARTAYAAYALDRARPGILGVTAPGRATIRVIVPAGPQRDRGVSYARTMRWAIAIVTLCGLASASAAGEATGRLETLVGWSADGERYAVTGFTTDGPEFFLEVREGTKILGHWKEGDNGVPAPDRIDVTTWEPVKKFGLHRDRPRGAHPVRGGAGRGVEHEADRSLSLQGRGVDAREEARGEAPRVGAGLRRPLLHDPRGLPRRRRHPRAGQAPGGVAGVRPGREGHDGHRGVRDGRIPR